MALPHITHIQFLILDLLKDQTRRGRYIRSALSNEGHKQSNPAFYQMMRRLENAKMIKGKYVPIEVDGQIVRERWYGIMAPGARAMAKTLKFYEDRIY